MSLSSVRPFFRTRLKALGYSEHIEPFDVQQVGANIIDRSFHMSTGTIFSSEANQIVHDFEYPIVIRIYRKGHRNMLDAYDEIHGEADTILADFLDPVVRLGTVIKDVVPDTINLVALDATNDNVIILEMNFTVKLELCYKD